MLGALVDHYERLRSRDLVPEYGFSLERIEFALVITSDGSPVSVEDLRDHQGKRPEAKRLSVPVDPEVTRSSAIVPFQLWDKTSYALGVTAGVGKRLQDEHEAFKQRQRELFEGVDDGGLRAFLAFLDAWDPSLLASLPGYTDEIQDANVVFRLDGARQYIHERDAARQCWQQFLEDKPASRGQCLVTGDWGPLADGHPAIKNVDGAQSSGAKLISYNISAFESHGKSGNDNAPIAKRAAFAYTTVLNHLLRRDETNHQRLRVGDATVVFWAEADEQPAHQAEDLFAYLLDPPTDDQASDALRTKLQAVAQGRPMAELGSGLDDNIRFYVLGLSPNSARLVVRFWFQNTLGWFADRLREHFEDIRIEPHRWNLAPALWRLLYATAAQGKADNIPPQLAGELFRAIITGGAYPRPLLVNALMRMRADGDVTDVRVALCKAVLSRESRLAGGADNQREEVPVSLDRESRNPGYRLGRLFAELENAQRLALGNVNAPIKDRYFGAASATPASVFPLLLRGVQSHISKLRKDGKGGLAHTVDTEIADIVDGLDERLPRSLRIQDQGQFAIGYYHQSHARFARKDTPSADDAGDHDNDQGDDA